MRKVRHLGGLGQHVVRKLRGAVHAKGSDAVLKTRERVLPEVLEHSVLPPRVLAPQHLGERQTGRKFNTARSGGRQALR